MCFSFLTDYSPLRYGSLSIFLNFCCDQICSVFVWSILFWSSYGKFCSVLFCFKTCVLFLFWPICSVLVQTNLFCFRLPNCVPISLWLHFISVCGFDCGSHRPLLLNRNTMQTSFQFSNLSILLGLLLLPNTIGNLY